MEPQDIHLIELLRDFPRYLALYWTILDKAGKLTPFIFNPAQQLIWDRIRRQKESGRAVRLRILKYRQAGVSAFGTALLQHSTMYGAGCTSLSLADKLDLPTQWLRRCQSWYHQTPNDPIIRPRLKASSATELYFDRLQSRYYIGSAEGTTPGMGATIRLLHCSEIASWRNPDAILGDLLPAVPPGPETVVLQESTGRAVGDWWYQRYHEAKRGEDSEGRQCTYEALFIPWFIQPEYTLPNVTWEDLGDLTERERLLVVDAEAYAATDGVRVGFSQLSPGQIAWRRSWIASEFHGDEDLFAQQFPGNDVEAFLAGGLQVFTPTQVELAQKTAREPIWKGDLLVESNPQDFRMEANPTGDLWIWDHPDDNYHYFLGADCQWGVKETADFDVLYVECLETGKICARMRGRYDMPIWARYIAAVGFMYNTCPVAPERNALASSGVMPVLLGNVADWRYPNVWIRTDDVKLRGHRPQDYGWLTNEHTKGEIVTYAKSATVNNAFDWCDQMAVDEMASYIQDEKLKMTAPEGAHDDCLMARMITGYGAHRLRERTDLYQPKVPKVYKWPSMADRLKESLQEEPEA